ncbi:hypothetical protein ILYODFUR_020110, partial [Ilyodon furcidens]
LSVSPVTLSGSYRQQLKGSLLNANSSGTITASRRTPVRGRLKHRRPIGKDSPIHLLDCSVHRSVLTSELGCLSDLRFHSHIEKLTPTRLNYSYSSSSAYPGPGRGGSRLSRDAQMSLQLLRVEPKAFPGQPRDIVPPACPGPSPGPPPGGTCLEHLPRKASRRHPV